MDVQLLGQRNSGDVDAIAQDIAAGEASGGGGVGDKEFVKVAMSPHLADVKAGDDDGYRRNLRALRAGAGKHFRGSEMRKNGVMGAEFDECAARGGC